MVIFKRPKKKITIIGGGNAGCLTALHYGYYTKKLPHQMYSDTDYEIELLHNPDRSPEKVGQGTLIDVVDLMWNALQFNWMENDVEATLKLGILYEGWGKKNDFVLHPLYKGTLHVSPNKLQSAILKSGYFEVKEGDDVEYEDIDSDYIFDCREKPAKIDGNDLYNELDGNVNAVILAQDSKRDLQQNWTRAVATPDGWCFSIPLFNSTSYGYLYNHKITSYEKAKENFEKLFNIKSEERFHFNQYVIKNPIIDDRIILNGNNLFYIDPLEATAMSSYLHWARLTYDWIVDSDISLATPDKITKEFQEYISKINHFISWHYSYGSKYNTPFWEEANRKSSGKFMQGQPEFDTILNDIKDHSLRDAVDFCNNRSIQNIYYAQWDSWYFKYWLNGMTSKIEYPDHYPFV